MKKVTVHFKSRSGDNTLGNVTYKTERHRDGKVTCFCKGYVYTGNCWHVERAKNYKK